MKKSYLIPILSLFSAAAIGAGTSRISMSMRSFNAGELSPLLNSRSDFDKYNSGAKTLENMLVRAQGPVQRRPGTRYIAEVKDANYAPRLITFEYSTDDAYIIEVGDEYMRFFRTSSGVSGQIYDGNDPYEISTPYDGNDVFELQYAQDAQYMRIVHPDYPPYKLTRTGHTSWTLTEIDFEGGPFMDENTDTTSTVYADANTGDVNIVSNSGIFDVNDVNSLFQITQILPSESLKSKFARFDDDQVHCYNPDSGISWASSPVTDDSNSIFVRQGRDFDFMTTGTWDGIITLEKSYDDEVTWQDVYVYTSNFSGNIQYAGSEENDDAYYRFHFDWASSHNTINCQLTLRSYTNHGIVKITTVSDANNIVATVDEDYPLADANTPTWRWAEGSWSDTLGWPRTVCHHEQRCIYGGSTSFPQTVWGSITASSDEDYDNFEAGINDDEAWTYVLPGFSPIQWMVSKEYLMLGTSSSIGRLGTPDKPLTPTFVQYKVQAQTGSAYIQAIPAVDGVLFVERGGQKIREMTYTYYSDRYIAPDMTILAEHITGDGITSMAFQNRPDPILWCIREDGTLLSFTYNRINGVEAWGRQETGTDDFEDVATMPGTTEDEVWAIVKRAVDSNTVRYVEKFEPFNWGTDQNDMWFVDCGSTDINDLSHLEGCDVALLANGRPIGTYTVSGGTISPGDANLTNFVVGLPYTSTYESMPLYVEGAPLSKTMILNLSIDFQKTLACEVGRDSTNISEIEFSEDSFATTIEPFTGLKPPVKFPFGIARDMTIYCQTAEPVPMTIRAIHPFVEVIRDP